MGSTIRLSVETIIPNKSSWWISFLDAAPHQRNIKDLGGWDNSLNPVCLVCFTALLIESKPKVLQCVRLKHFVSWLSLSPTAAEVTLPIDWLCGKEFKNDQDSFGLCLSQRLVYVHARTYLLSVPKITTCFAKRSMSSNLLLVLFHSLNMFKSFFLLNSLS